jgi:hypothetical protein
MKAKDLIKILEQDPEAEILEFIYDNEDMTGSIHQFNNLGIEYHEKGSQLGFEEYDLYFDEQDVSLELELDLVDSEFKTKENCFLFKI